MAAATTATGTAGSRGRARGAEVELPFSVERFRLDGRVALVTGGGRGIGRAIALGMAGAGADVCVVARHVDQVSRVADAVRALGRRALAVSADLRDPGAPPHFLRRMLDGLGVPDIVVNNAGASDMKSEFVDSTMSEWKQHFDLLFTAHASVTQEAVRAMRAGGRPGVVVNVSSIFGLRGAPGGEKELGSVSYYTAAKHALVGLTRALAIELAPIGVRVNALCPGWVDTAMNPSAGARPEFLRRNLDQIPMGRWGAPEEMVGPAIFLASDASSFMTGQTLVVDGGHLA